MDYEKLAQDVASKAHLGQTDKSGVPYITHPARVVEKLKEQGADDATLAVAWLHDVVEDTDVSLRDLQDLGFPDTIVHAVNAMSKRPLGETLEQYLARVKANPLALQVKLADVADNTDPKRTALLDRATRQRLASKYARTLEILRN